VPHKMFNFGDKVKLIECSANGHLSEYYNAEITFLEWNEDYPKGVMAIVDIGGKDCLNWYGHRLELDGPPPTIEECF
jgi:hypothetical protein